MPILTEMDAIGSAEQRPNPSPKSQEKKNNLITNFFKSPPSNRNKLREPDLDGNKYNENSRPIELEETSVDDELNDSLCDFEPNIQVTSVKKSKKAKSKKQKQGKTSKKKDDPHKSKYVLETALDIPTAVHDNFSETKNVVSRQQKKYEEQDTMERVSKENVDGSDEVKKDINNVSDRSLSDDTKRSEISYEDFLKLEAVECGNETRLSSDTDSKETSYALDNSVILLEESDGGKTGCKKNVSPKCVSQTKKKGSFFTILPSRQLSQTSETEKAPVVITVDVHSDRSSSPDSVFSIFNKNRSNKNSRKDSTNKYDFTGCASPKSNVATEDDSTITLHEKETKRSQSVRKGKKKINIELISGSSKLDNTLEDSIVALEDDEVIEINKQSLNVTKEKISTLDSLDKCRQQTKIKLSSLDKVVVHPVGKNTQSTLCFDKGGLSAVKPANPTVDVVSSEKSKDKETQPKPTLKTKRTKADKKGKLKTGSDADSPIKKAGKAQKNRKNCIESDVEVDVKELCQTPKKRRKRKQYISESSDDFEESKQERKRRRSTRVYSAELVESPIPMKKAPIKIRLTRLKSVNVDSEGHKLSTVTKAQQLLQKAKGGRKKNIASSPKEKKMKTNSSKNLKQCAKNNKTDTNEESNLRRSSRSCSQAARLAINDCFEVHESGKEKPTSSKENKMTPQKKATVKTTTKTEPKSKKTGKLAPIFAKKNVKAIVIDSDEELPPEKVIDPEILKAQRNFLLSGVPEKLKQSKAALAAMYSDHPPFPKITHVQQVPQVESELEYTIWNLPVPDMKIKLKELALCNITVDHTRLSDGFITDSKFQDTAPRINENNHKTEELHEDVIKYLLGEINLTNSQYPVRRMYKQLKKKQQQGQDLNSEEKTKCDSQPDKTLDVTTVPRKSRKRKLEDEMNSCTELAGKRLSLRKNKRRRGAENLDESVPSENEKLPQGHTMEFVDSVVPLNSSNSNGLSKTRTNETNSSSSNSNQGTDILWTEKYQPTCASDILGNTKQVKKLWTWLKDWKQKTDLELKRLKKLLMKDARKGKISKEEVKRKLGGDCWSDGDSDFDIDSASDNEESEYEDNDTLCNTMVLIGPHGAGKTATVNALSAELGYKIFEVNASSKRSGKQILAQLQEATQSHQVCKENLDAMYTTFMSLAKNKDNNPEEKPEKKMPTAFANFFKKNDTNKTNEVTPKEAKLKKGKPQKKCKEDTSDKKGKNISLPMKDNRKDILDASSAPADTPSKRKGLNLSSTSLILFDEVDVVFEDDKGFWAAIQTFMSTTKRPIILTSSDSNITQLIDGRHEVIKLKSPVTQNIASYLQTMCLAENIRTDYNDLVSVAGFCNNDIRKCVNLLQFWKDSGAGMKTENRPVRYSAKFIRKSTEEPSTVSSQTAPSCTPVRFRSIVDQLNTSTDNDDDFVSISRPHRSRRAIIASDDDDSRDSFIGSPARVKPVLGTLTEEAEDSQGSQGSQPTGVMEEDTSDILTVADMEMPPVHTGCVDSMILCKTESRSLLNTLRDKRSTTGGSLLLNIQLGTRMKDVGSDLVYSHLHHLLRLPKFLQASRPSSSLTDGIYGCKPQTFRRIIKQASDIFHSDSSSDEEKEKCGEKSSMPVTKNLKREKDPGAHIMIDSLSALSEMYDSLSYCDAYISKQSESKEGICPRQLPGNWCPGKLSSGMSDVRKTYSENNWWKHNHANDIMSQVHCRSLNKANKLLGDSLERLESISHDTLENVKSRLYVPVAEEALRRVQLNEESSHQSSLRSSCTRTTSYVADCLPLHVRCPRSVVTEEYLPTIRLICKSEQLRQATNTKRRFLHYFDSISFGATRKQSILDALCSSFS